MKIEDVKIDKKKLYLLTFGITAVILSILGVTYAFFKIPIDNQEESSSMTLSSANLQISFEDSSEIGLKRMLPGQSITKTFRIENHSSVPFYYDLLMEVNDNTIVGNDFVYTITSTNGGESVSETVMPTSTDEMVTKVLIGTGVTQTYTMTMTFKNQNYDQSINQGAVFNGRILMQTPYTVSGETLLAN